MQIIDRKSSKIAIIIISSAARFDFRSHREIGDWGMMLRASSELKATNEDNLTSSTNNFSYYEKT